MLVCDKKHIIVSGKQIIYYGQITTIIKTDVDVLQITTLI